jgi:hypothetical protein
VRPDKHYFAWTGAALPPPAKKEEMPDQVGQDGNGAWSVISI